MGARLFPQRLVIGVGFLIYAAAFAARSESALLLFMEDRLNVSGELVALLFAACGTVLVLVPVSPAWRLVLCLPLALMFGAGVLRALETPSAALSAVWSYGFALVLIITQAFREARRGSE